MTGYGITPCLALTCLPAARVVHLNEMWKLNTKYYGEHVKILG